MSVFARFSPAAPQSAATSPAAPSSEAPSSAAPARVAPRGVIGFEEIIEKYHPKVFQLVYRYTGDYEEASDLTQDTFVRAFAAWGEFRGESQIYTWLYRIALNLCHNQQKKTGRRRRVEQPLEIEPSEGGLAWTPLQVADARPLPGQQLENRELRARLNGALRALPDNYRTVIVLRDIEGLTYDEIARVTDSSLEAIKSRLFRARGAMRRLMEPYLSGEESAATSASSEQPLQDLPLPNASSLISSFPSR